VGGWAGGWAGLYFLDVYRFYLPCMYCGSCCAAHAKKVAKKSNSQKGLKALAAIEP